MLRCKKGDLAIVIKDCMAISVLSGQTTYIRLTGKVVVCVALFPGTDRWVIKDSIPASFVLDGVYTAIEVTAIPDTHLRPLPDLTDEDDVTDDLKIPTDGETA